VRVSLAARISLDSDDRPAGDEPQLTDASSRLGLGAVWSMGVDITRTVWIGPSIGAEWRPIELGQHRVYDASTALTLSVAVGLRL